MQRIERLGYQDADGVIIFESVRGAKDNRNRTDKVTELPGDKKTPTEKNRESWRNNERCFRRSGAKEATPIGEIKPLSVLCMVYLPGDLLI